MKRMNSKRVSSWIVHWEPLNRADTWQHWPLVCFALDVATKQSAREIIFQRRKWNCKDKSWTHQLNGNPSPAPVAPPAALASAAPGAAPAAAPLELTLAHIASHLIALVGFALVRSASHFICTSAFCFSIEICSRSESRERLQLDWK